MTKHVESEETTRIEKETKKAGCGKGVIIVVILIFGLSAISMLINRYSDNDTPRVPVAPTSNPYRYFTTIENDCGLCGTDSPIGGWEAADGRTLVLSDDRSFIYMSDDGTIMSGNWANSSSRLCLEPETGSKVCFNYQQKVDAMKLDDAIYIRQ